MHFNLIHLNDKSGAEFVSAFASIPSDVTALNLGGNQLGDKSNDDLAKAFALIPCNVANLTLSCNKLNNKSAEDLAKTFLAIPRGVSTLNLSLNELAKNKSADDLAKIFLAIPRGVTTLDLSGSPLNEFSGDDLAKVFAAIPDGVTTLHLRGHGLGDRSSDYLTNFFSSIPRSVTTLDLSTNFLLTSAISSNDMAEAFMLLPNRLTTINLGSNCGACRQAADYLIKIITAIPTSVTTLDLSNTIAFYRPKSELIKVFSAIPVNVTTLNLRANSLHKLAYHSSGDTLAKVFMAMPRNVTTLDLSCNAPDDNADDYLAKVFAAIPEHINTIILSKKQDIEKLSEKNIISLGKALPHVIKIHVVDESHITRINHPYVNEMNKHIGGWIKGADQELSALLPKKITDLILETGTGIEANQISSFTHQSKQERIQIIRTQFESHLGIINEKAGQLKKRGHGKAYDAANVLHAAFDQLKDQYCGGVINHLVFQEQSKQVIATARSELEKHRGWKEVLVNIALSILGLGIGYLAVCAYKGSFFTVNTDSANKLDDLQHTIDTANVIFN